MPNPKALSSSARSRRLASRRERQRAKAAFREDLLEFVIAGHSHEMIARLKKISVATVRREVARALQARPVEAPERFIALQRARLDTALQAVNEALDDGDLGAIDPFLKVMAGLDRYHGLAARLAASTPGPEALSRPVGAPLALPRAEAKPAHEVTLNPLISNES